MRSVSIDFFPCRKLGIFSHKQNQKRYVVDESAKMCKDEIKWVVNKYTIASHTCNLTYMYITPYPNKLSLPIWNTSTYTPPPPKKMLLYITPTLTCWAFLLSPHPTTTDLHYCIHVYQPLPWHVGAPLSQSLPSIHDTVTDFMFISSANTNPESQVKTQSIPEFPDCREQDFWPWEMDRDQAWHLEAEKVIYQEIIRITFIFNPFFSCQILIYEAQLMNYK